MPKYLVTSGSHFEPFTYDELVKPVMAAQQMHNQAQDVYDALEMDTAALDRYISSEEGSGDEETRKLYDNYMNRLNALQEELYNNGYSSKVKRGLSEARKMYASDISRISKAIEARQNRSAEYWKNKHEHPEMIMAEDPGLSGLDKYLNDDMYGQNYYQYSGADFEQQMAKAAKARANEAFSAPQYLNNPAMAGYKQRIDNEGFTNAEVDAAVDAIRYGGAEDLDVPSRILYDALLNGLTSTGARENVSDDEYNRLIEYGRSGLSQAVGTTRYTDIQDRAWQTPSGGSSGSGGPQTGTNGYTINSAISSFQTPGYADMAKSMRKQERKYENNATYTIVNNDGTSENVGSVEHMTQLVYNPELRRESRQRYGGLDIALPAKELEKQTAKESAKIVYGDGQTLEVKVKPLDDGRVGIYYNSPEGLKLHKALTEDFNNRRNQYQEHINNYAKNNGSIKDFEKYAMSPSQEQKIREKYNIPPTVDTDDVFAIQSTKERVGDSTEAVLFNSNVGMDAAQKTLAGTIYESFNKAITREGGKLPKDSKHAFYPVEEGGFGKSTQKKDAITKIDDIFKNGDVENNLASVTFTPEDIAQGAGNGRPMFRFISKSRPGEFTADAEMLGDLTWNQLKAPINEEPYYGMSMCDAVNMMMQPIMNSEKVMSWSDEQSEEWLSTILSILNGSDMSRYQTTGYLSGPMFSEDGQISVVSPQDIIRYPQLQDKLYRDITTYINEQLSNTRDLIQQNHAQYTGNTSANAQTYLPQ